MSLDGVESGLVSLGSRGGRWIDGYRSGVTGVTTEDTPMAGGYTTGDTVGSGSLSTKLCPWTSPFPSPTCRVPGRSGSLNRFYLAGLPRRGLTWLFADSWSRFEHGE